MPSPIQTVLTRVGGGLALRVHDADLPLGAVLVGRHQPIYDLLGGETLGEKVEAVGAVGQVGPGLCGERANFGPRPGYDSTDG